MSEKEKTHIHILDDGTVVEHVHSHEVKSEMLELEECEAQKKDDGEIHTHTHAEGEGHVHTHVHDDGTVHAHEHTEGHGHTHSHTHTKAVVNRLSRAIGHLESIRRMVENGRDCSEVLIQLSAVKAAINNTGKVILQDHIEHCIVDAVEQGDREALDELSKAIDRFMK
jgi:DNA-binding FrmR family transcriptional regulator